MVHAAQFNGKQESRSRKTGAACAAPATVKQLALKGAISIIQPLGALKQVSGKAMEAALPARIPANKAAAPCVKHRAAIEPKHWRGSR